MPTIDIIASLCDAALRSDQFAIRHAISRLIANLSAQTPADARLIETLLASHSCYTPPEIQYPDVLLLPAGTGMSMLMGDSPPDLIARIRATAPEAHAIEIKHGNIECISVDVSDAATKIVAALHRVE